MKSRIFCIQTEHDAGIREGVRRHYGSIATESLNDCCDCCKTGDFARLGYTSGDASCTAGAVAHDALEQMLAAAGFADIRITIAPGPFSDPESDCCDSGGTCGFAAASVTARRPQCA